MTKDDLNSLSWPAMRYALGRKTYVVDIVSRTLIRNSKDIRNDIKQRMCEKIINAINSNKAGREIDVEQWKQVLESFQE